MKALAATSRMGEVIGGKYRIVRLLASGGMGLVYEAQHTVVHRRFAIKLLRPELAERRDILARFQREAEAAGALENENVAAAVDFGIADDGTPYIVMEYLVGESLEALLGREGRLPVTRAADLIVQACRGVAAAHAADIVHRDLKPQNLFVSRREDGTDLVKVLDFGVAKLQALEEASAATRTGTLIGTVAYMSPEQARGEKTVDARADIYALGAIFYELVSQQRPHPGGSQNAILHHIATHAAVPIASVRPDLPAGLAALVDGVVASDLALRPPSADALGRALAPFARRDVWPPPSEDSSEDSGRARLDRIDTLRAESDDRDGEASASGSMRSGPAAENRASTPREPRGRVRSRALFGAGLLIAVSAVAVVAGRKVNAPAARPVSQQPARRTHRLDPNTRFLSLDPPPGAVAQIASLRKANDKRDAALLSAMVATPAGIWFVGGSPDQVRAQVGEVITRGERRGRMPVLVASQRPFRNCAGYEIMGAVDTAAYKAWIDGFVAGIGNEPVIVLLEPNGLGLMPHGRQLSGEEDECKPMQARPDGTRVPAPGATPEERYLQLNYAVDVLAAKAPNAGVYLDGTHSDWLPIGDAAYRLVRAGVDRTAGFFLNVGNFQSTRPLIQYGTAIAKCIYYVRTAPPGAAGANRYADCPRQPHYEREPEPSGSIADWAKVAAWYVEHVDRSAHPPPAEALTHFVINTNRNGRGPLDVTVYERAPYNQPPSVLEVLHYGVWCMPPGRGVGLRPTPNTGVPLVDAYLWAEMPGICNASCDIAGGARAWDYSRYNPWGIAGDAQNQFDPLWGRVLPSSGEPIGEWFPDQALELARNATPPLDADTSAPVPLVKK